VVAMVVVEVVDLPWTFQVLLGAGAEDISRRSEGL